MEHEESRRASKKNNMFESINHCVRGLCLEFCVCEFFLALVVVKLNDIKPRITMSQHATMVETFNLLT